MTDLEAATLASIAQLCSSAFRMRAVIGEVVGRSKDAGEAPERVRHWLLLDDALAHLLDCMEKAAEVESNKAMAEEIADGIAFMTQSVDTEEAQARAMAERLRQAALRPYPEIE